MTNIELEVLSMAKAALRKYNAGEIDWEQRRYEIAKDVLAAYATTQDGIVVEIDVPSAVRIADDLIKELKGGKPCE